jgi:hypothetical protein
VSDFAFDHLKDEVPHSEKLDLNYEDQQVAIHTETEATAEKVKEVIEEYSLEKVNDLLWETKNGYDTGFEVNELQTIQRVVTTSIEIQEE